MPDHCSEVPPREAARRTTSWLRLSLLGRRSLVVRATADARPAARLGCARHGTGRLSRVTLAGVDRPTFDRLRQAAAGPDRRGGGAMGAEIGNLRKNRPGATTWWGWVR